MRKIDPSNNKKKIYYPSTIQWTKGFRSAVFINFSLPIIFHLFIRIENIDRSLLEIVGNLFLFISIIIFIWGITLQSPKKNYWENESHIGFTVIITLIPLGFLIYQNVTH